MFRRRAGSLEVLLVHPGGPFWAKKDAGAWSIPKGEIDTDENELDAARREFEEETGVRAQEPFIPLPPVKQKSGKLVLAWAFEGNLDLRSIRSNTFTMEWPPKSGRQQEFPEIDRAEFFAIEEAKHKIVAGQVPFVTELEKQLSPGSGTAGGVLQHKPEVPPRGVPPSLFD